MHSPCLATLLQSAASPACAIPTVANNQGKACEQREDVGAKEQKKPCKVELNVMDSFVLNAAKDISATDVKTRIIFFKEVMNLIYKIY